MTGELRRVLAATDLSPAAGEAIRQARARAAEAGAELGVCLAIPGELDLGVYPLFPQRHAEAAQELARRPVDAEAALREHVFELLGNSPARLFVQSGWPHAQVLRVADEWGADLVVVGSTGASGLSRALLGGTAERIARHAGCPVLIARSSSPNGGVLAGTDFSDPALPAVHAAAREARRTGGTLTVAHAVDLTPVVGLQPWAGMWDPSAFAPDLRNEVEGSVRVRLEQALAQVGATGECAVLFGPAAAMLVQAAEQRGSALMVVGTTGRTGLRRMLLGSVAETVARLAPCSVLVVRLGSSADPTPLAQLPQM